MEVGQTAALCLGMGHRDLVHLGTGWWSASVGARIPGSEGSHPQLLPLKGLLADDRRGGVTSVGLGAQRAMEGDDDCVGGSCGRGAMQGGSRRMNDIRDPGAVIPGRMNGVHKRVPVAEAPCNY